MRHLSTVEIVDFIEGRLRDDRAAHVHACPACREQASDLRATISSVRSVEVPEPSPLFWDHLSARVRDAVADEPLPRASWWSRWSADLVGVAGAAAAAAVIVTAVLGTYQLSNTAPDPGIAGGPGGITQPADSSAGEIVADDPGWSLVVSVADGYDSDAALDAGLRVPDAITEDAVSDLSVDERRELARLLESALQPKS